MSIRSYNYGNKSNLKILLFIVIILMVIFAMIILLNIINNNNNTKHNQVVKENYYDIKNDYINLMNKKRNPDNKLSDNSIILSNYMEKSKLQQNNLDDIGNKIKSAENQLYLLKNGNNNNIYTVKPSHSYQYINSMTHYA